MKLRFKNIGPLREAEINLDKDLIVLCGGNNTGKTYLAYSVYGLYKNIQYAFANDYPFVKENPIIERLIKTKEYKNLPIAELYHVYKNSVINRIEKKFIDSLPSLFGTNLDLFNSAELNIVIDEYLPSSDKRINRSTSLIDSPMFKMITGRGGYLEVLNLKKERSIDITYIRPDSFSGNFEIEELNLIEKGLSYIFLEFCVFDYFLKTPNIAPAERAAINIFNKEIGINRSKLIDTLLESKGDPFDSIRKSASLYPLPIREALLLANNLGDYRNNKSNYSYIADELEVALLKGKMEFTQDGEMQFAPDDFQGVISIHQSASVVKSLASIIFYLRHIAGSNDLLIIDEPELNLHPDNQRKIARAIAMMVNAGIKVIISTHSDYIIRELNNLIMLHVKGNDKAVQSLMDKYGYQKEHILNPEKVGVYLFTDKVSELPVTELGFEIESIDNEINALNESASEIFFTLHDR